MIGKKLGLYIFLVFSLCAAQAEDFRIYRTPQGQSFNGKAVGYEGQTIILADEGGSFVKIPLSSLSRDDQVYLVESVKAKRIPQGMPKSQSSGTSVNSASELSRMDQNRSSTDNAATSLSPNGVELESTEKIRRPKPPKKELLRVGSFFAHLPVPLGVSPDEAMAKAKGAKPKPGELIDFDRHVLPILEQKCNDCHHAPFDRSGRLVNPKASLRFDTYEQVMKGNLDGPVVVANDLDNSNLYTVINLPEDDDMFMPPKGGALDTDQIDIIKRWITEGAKPSKSSVSPTTGGVPNANEPVSFNHHILPLFEQRCMECHGAPYVKNSRTIKPKAGLRLDTYEWVLKGNLDGTIVTPGDHFESTLFSVITLDEDDPEIMPPKGDPLSEEQVTMIKRWILEGAGEQPAAVAADPNAVPKPKETKVVLNQVQNQPTLLESLARRAKIPSRTQIAGAEKTGALVRQLSERNSLVRAEFSSFASEIDDSALSAFGGIKNNISHLDVSRTRITDKTILGASSYPNLTWLSARNTMVTDNGLKTLPSLQFLRYINLSGTKVSDKGIMTLATMTDLEEIYLWNSEVSEKGVEMLRKSLPKTKIIAGL